jgi:ribose transport system permease protein
MTAAKLPSRLAGDHALPALLCAALFVANLAVQPSFVAPGQIDGTLVLAAPFLLAAIASTPAIMSGGGGIDLSVGPLIGVVNVVLVAWLVPHGLGGIFLAVPILLGLGLLVGTANGLLVAVVRLQPIVATLGSYLVLSGAALLILAEPGGEVPAWVAKLGGAIGPVPGALFLLGPAVLAWLGIRRTAFHTALRAVGGDAPAAYSAGVDVTRVRVLAYALGGCFAALGGIALSALIDSGDPNQGAQYTLVAVAAVALGGTSLAGGRGGVLGSILGALIIFLIQNLLSALLVSPLWLQVVYGGVLVLAVVADGIKRRLPRRGEARFA